MHKCTNASVCIGIVRQDIKCILYLVLHKLYIIIHVNLRQQTRDKITINLVVILMKTITDFWNMSKASAPIHMMDTREK